RAFAKHDAGCKSCDCHGGSNWHAGFRSEQDRRTDGDARSRAEDANSHLRSKRHPQPRRQEIGDTNRGEEPNCDYGPNRPRRGKIVQLEFESASPAARCPGGLYFLPFGRNALVLYFARSPRPSPQKEMNHPFEPPLVSPSVTGSSHPEKCGQLRYRTIRV